MKEENPFRYAGYFYDEETDYYYLLARYYDAGTGRFTSRDPVPNINLYYYCDNDPVNGVDPSGNYTKRQYQTAYNLLSLISAVFASIAIVCSFSPWLWGFTGIAGDISWAGGFGAWLISAKMYQKKYMKKNEFIVGTVLSISGIVMGWRSRSVKNIVKYGWKEVQFIASRMLSIYSVVSGT